jgi:hypothetical protein
MGALRKRVNVCKRAVWGTLTAALAPSMQARALAHMQGVRRGKGGCAMQDSRVVRGEEEFRPHFEQKMG